MKKLLAIIMCLSIVFAFCGCGENKSNSNCSIDGVYLSLSGATDPVSGDLTMDEFFQYNPDCLLENKSDNDDVGIFVLLSFKSNNDKDDDYNIGSFSEFTWKYNNNSADDVLDLNDYNNKASKFLGNYKKTNEIYDYTLYGGSNDRVGVAGMFWVKYHDYKKAIEENGKIEISCYGNKIIANGNSIKVVNCPKEIGKDITNGYIN